MTPVLNECKQIKAAELIRTLFLLVLPLIVFPTGCNSVAVPSHNKWTALKALGGSKVDAPIVPISNAQYVESIEQLTNQTSNEIFIDRHTDNEMVGIPSAGLNEESFNRTEYRSDGAFDIDGRIEVTKDDLKDETILREDAWVLSRLMRDQSNFYSRESLLGLGVVFGTGAAVANSGFDEQIQKHFQASVRGATSDEWFEFLHSNKELGNGRYSLPVFGTLWVANEYIDGPPVFETFGRWGERSMRGFLVGAPPLVLMQRITGGSRPLETAEGAQWHPMRDNNGVSGHAFMSSLPFITAAKMSDDPWQKTLWYSASAIGPLSRVNDNAHYPSQIGLGWAMAFMAATAVNQTHTGKRGWSLVSSSTFTTSGASLQYVW